MLGSFLNKDPFLGTQYEAAPFKKGSQTSDPNLENYPYRDFGFRCQVAGFG